LGEDMDDRSEKPTLIIRAANNDLDGRDDWNGSMTAPR
jgi:hypothetical protein